MTNLKTLGVLLFLVAALATWFLIPLQPRRVLHASRDPDRVFVRVLPGGQWALTARVKKEEDSFGRINVKNVAPIRLYDLNQGRELQELISNGEMWSYSLAKLSPDGKLLAVSIEDRSLSSPLYVWDLESLKLLAKLPRNNNRIMEQDRDICCFSTDGRFVAYLTATYQNKISENGQVKITDVWNLRLWNKDTGSDVDIGPANLISIVAFSPDSKQIAVGFSVFNTSDGSKHATLELPPSQKGPAVCQWTPNGENVVLLAPTYDHQQPTRIDVTYWNPSKNESRQLVLAADHNLRLDSANFSYDGRYLLLQDRTSGASEVWAMYIGPPTRVGYSLTEEVSPTPENPFAVVGENPVRQRLWKIDTPLDQAPIMLDSELVIQSIQFNSTRSLVSISHFSNEKKWILDFWETNSLKRVSRFNLKGHFSGFSNSGGTFFKVPPSRSSSVLHEWDVIPTPPWRWLIPAWFVEAGLIAWLTRWAERRQRFNALRSGELECINDVDATCDA